MKYRLINGRDLNLAQFKAVKDMYDRHCLFDIFWIETHDFAFCLDNENVPVKIEPPENINVAISLKDELGEKYAKNIL